MVDRLPWVSGEVFIGALCYMHPLIWRGVYPGVHLIMHGACDRIAIYEQFLGVVPGSLRRPPSSSARCTPSGHVWRVISRRTTERNRAIKPSLILATLGSGTEPDYDR